jgi:hypothetical protein
VIYEDNHDSVNSSRNGDKVKANMTKIRLRTRPPTWQRGVEALAAAALLQRRTHQRTLERSKQQRLERSWRGDIREEGAAEAREELERRH